MTRTLSDQVRYAATLAVVLLVPMSSAAVDDGARARDAFARGMVASEAGDHETARLAFAEATQLAPQWALAHVQLGATLLALDPTSQPARLALERGVELDAGSPRAHLLLGLAYEDDRRYDDAARELRAALALRPDLPEARYHLAAVLAETGPVEAAITAYQAVLQQEPEHIGALAAVAELYEASSDLASAEAALLAITRLHPAIPYHQYRLGQFYQRIGDRKKAARIFAKLEEKDPRRRRMRKLR